MRGIDANSETSFQEPVDFTGTTFIDEVWFKGTKFRNDANFKSAHFGSKLESNKRVIFAGVQFDQHANFMCAQFKIRPIFNSANFSMKPDFCKVRFHKGAAFKGTQFNKGAIFEEAKFSGTTSFKRSKFDENVDFECARFVEEAYFANATFNGNAKFVESRFIDCDANFIDTQFDKYADFVDTKFGRDLILDRARIYRLRLSANFDDKSNISLKDADFDQLVDVRWNDIKKHLDYEKNGATVYLSLVKHFKTMGFFDDADDCYYVCRDKMKYEGTSISSKFYDIIFHLSCGYGVRPGYTLALILAVMFIFWVLFLGCSRSIFESMYFSSTSLTGTPPTDMPIGAWKYAMMLESVLGYILLALFVVVLARKLIR